MSRLTLFARAALAASLLALAGCSGALSNGHAVGSDLIVGYDASDVASLPPGARIELDLRAAGVVYEIDGTLAPVATDAFQVLDDHGVVALSEYLADTGAATDAITDRLRLGTGADRVVAFDEPAAGELGTASEALGIGVGGVGCPPPYGGGYICTDFGTCVCSGDFDCNRLFCEMDCPSGSGCTERGGVLNCWCRINSYQRVSSGLTLRR